MATISEMTAGAYCDKVNVDYDLSSSDTNHSPNVKSLEQKVTETLLVNGISAHSNQQLAELCGYVAQELIEASEGFAHDFRENGLEHLYDAISNLKKSIYVNYSATYEDILR